MSWKYSRKISFSIEIAIYTRAFAWVSNVVYGHRVWENFSVGISSFLNESLWSIQSFTGCLNVSYYGENCSTPCHQNCLKGRCDVVDGTCFDCIPGYTGSTCDTGCNAIIMLRFRWETIDVEEHISNYSM